MRGNALSAGACGKISGREARVPTLFDEERYERSTAVFRFDQRTPRAPFVSSVKHDRRHDHQGKQGGDEAQRPEYRGVPFLPLLGALIGVNALVFEQVVGNAIRFSVVQPSVTQGVDFWVKTKDPRRVVL